MEHFCPHLRKNDRIAELKRKLDDVLFKRICASGKREEFADIIANLNSNKGENPEFERLEVPGGTDKAPKDPLVVSRAAIQRFENSVLYEYETTASKYEQLC